MLASLGCVGVGFEGSSQARCLKDFAGCIGFKGLGIRLESSQGVFMVFELFEILYVFKLYVF